MKRLILGFVALVLIAVVGFAASRTMRFTAPPPSAAVAVPNLRAIQVDANLAAQHLGAAVRFRTVSLAGVSTDEPAQFEQFQAWMQVTYPHFHAVATREVIGDFNLLYTWPGSDPAQPPLLLLAHQDVVPVPPDTRAAWTHDPFGGEIVSDAVWGRGSIDDKGSLVALLEAAEALAAQGRKPKRTILLAFGHDEEIGGTKGAAMIAAHLHDAGIRAWFALDEGLAVVAKHPLTGSEAALIGISEKGFGTLRITAHGEPGHSSMPPRETAISTLAEAVTRVHDMPIAHSLEGGGPALDMMRALAPDMSLTNRVAIANEWLAGPLLQQKLANNRAAQALLGTTVAPTVISGGSRPNVLPGEATALINLRIHPRDTTASLLARARDAVKALPGVTVTWDSPPLDPSPVSRVDSSSYALIAALSRSLYPDAPVAPGLVLGGTDSRLYGDVAENIYRFQPLIVTDQDLEGIHGVNEHISVQNFHRMVQFYIGLMQSGAM